MIMDGYLAVGCFIGMPEQGVVGPLLIAATISRSQRILSSINEFVSPDERFPPNDIYLL